MTALDSVEDIVALKSGDSPEVMERVRRVADEHGVGVTEFHVSTNLEDEIDLDPSVLGLTLGGDGTFLEGVKEFSPHGVPLLAINTGTLGFLARISPQDADMALSEALSGDADIIEREQLAVEGGGLEATGINDVMMQSTEPETPTDRKICTVHVWIGGEYAGAYDGDGIAVSTPTGSTGVALSAGGPIHYPNDNNSLQITPLNTHNIGVRSLIVNSGAGIRLVPDDRVKVMVDGGRTHSIADPETEFTIAGADRSARIVRTGADESFFDALSGSLGWGLRGIDDPGPY